MMMNSPKNKILIIEDEIELAEIIRDYLSIEGFEVAIAMDGFEGLKIFESFSPHLIILDLMLPRISGSEICKKIRATSSVPIIILSAKGADLDKIVGLGNGADDYITKPFNPAELVARVKAQLRRYLHLAKGQENTELIQINQLSINTKSHTVMNNQQEVMLSTKEYEVLLFLFQNPNQVFTREQLFNQIWGFEEFGDINTVTVHIRKIREKIEDKPSEPQIIKTVWGVGYKLEGVRL